MSHISTSAKSRRFGAAALAVAASVVLASSGFGAQASELPTYQVDGFVMTPLQQTLLTPANAEERLPEAASVYGSPHQITVLTPRGQPKIRAAAPNGKASS
jgi:hypothetical protein